MRFLICILFFLLVFETTPAQNRSITSFTQLQSVETVDSLRRLLTTAIDDSNRVLALHGLTYPLLFSAPDSAMLLAQEGLKLALSINYAKGLILCKTDIGAVWWILGDNSKATLLMLENLKLAERLNNAEAFEWTLSFLMSVYRDQGEPREALKYAVRGLTKNEYFSNEMWNTMTGSVYLELNKVDSALFFLQRGDMGGYNLLLLGNAYRKIGDKGAAINYYKKSIQYLSSLNNFKDMALVYAGVSGLYQEEENSDSAIYMAKKGFDIAQQASFKKGIFETSSLLSRLYEQKDKGQALHYLKLAVEVKDSMINQRKITEAVEWRYNEQLQERELTVAKMNYQNRLRTIIFSSALGAFSIVVIILFRSNRHKQKAKIKIENAYKDLKTTQARLIQSEKMASLGELTAGIAHEIQNPLNFVNNFSDVSNELLDEIKNELDKGNKNDAIAIVEDVKQNLKKILHHGKRADAIVKGMLEHSRPSSGQKEPTDMNVLADEYLRLSFHGLRAKDKSFNAKFETHFDNSIGKVSVIPQDIGRVILNLINNAFYAVPEKKRHVSAGTASNGYEPTVTVTTKKENGKIEIKVKDNGIGIPQKVLDKIFQPFFTTKPTGQGTGLGLSLAYDIVTKGHGGELKVETKEGEGSEFIIQLPVAKNPDA